MASEVFSFVDGIRSRFGFLGVPYLPFVLNLKKEKDNLQFMVSGMKEIQLCLEAEIPKQNSSVKKALLVELRYRLLDAEDLVEELSPIEAQWQLINGNENIAAKVCGFLSILPSHIRIACQMKHVSDRLKEDEENYKKYYIPQALQKMEEPQSYVPADMFIGRDDDKKRIKDLLEKASTERNVSIIPIYGIGGLGKTTLARSVYDDFGKDYFEVKAWAWASSTADDFDVKAVVKKIIESHTRKACEVTDMNQLEDRLREILDGKKYLLVLDDVWNTNHVKWDDLKRLLMGGASGSVLLVTTRSRHVARMMGNTGEPYKLQVKLSAVHAGEIALRGSSNGFELVDI